ncbi:MAG: hypothetical protein GX663_08815 [Clostridiales bacterium]|nr:hypothetical protein [Clostridiales bacterium]
MNNITRKVFDTIYHVFDELKLNNFVTLGRHEEPIWDRPLIGVAAGDDPYYEFLKEHIGAFHWSPAEAFALKYGTDSRVSTGNLRVLSMVFPQTKATKDMQNKATVFPCDNWVVSRGEWEPLMREFAPKLENALEDLGCRTASIDLRKEFSRHESEKQGIASSWSHRHSAFAAGLGTFGLSDGFISEKGIAIRITSAIIEADLDVTDRGDRGPYDWCLYHKDGSCGACINRCPVDSISKEGHDKNICSAYEDEACLKYWPKHIERGDYIFGCGLCQVKVPCRDNRPL